MTVLVCALLLVGAVLVLPLSLRGFELQMAWIVAAVCSGALLVIETIHFIPNRKRRASSNPPPARMETRKIDFDAHYRRH